MRSAVVLLLAALLAVSSAYISSVTYYAVGRVEADYLTYQSTNQNTGIFVIQYDAKSKRMEYEVLTTLTSVGSVTMNGPASCYYKAGGYNYQPDSMQCVQNTAPVVFKLGAGVKTAGDGASFQSISGAVTLSSIQESMLFRGEFYIVVNTITVSPQTGKDVDLPLLRGPVNIFDNQNNNMFSILRFQANDGTFDRDHKSKSTNAGFGFIAHNPTPNGGGSEKQLYLRLFTTIKQPGQYLLKCTSGSKTLATNNNPIDTTITFSDTEAPLLLELFVKGSCYVLITSAEYPTGDLFAWFQHMGVFEVQASGAKEVPAVPSAYFGFSTITFDYGSKTLDISTKHNFTTGSVTAAYVQDKNGVTLCNLAANNNPFPARSFCQINATSVDDLENGDLYLQIATALNPAGEIRGPIVFNGQSKAAVMGSSTSGNSMAIGLGIGLGLGVPLVIGAALAGVYFLKGPKGKI